MLRRALRAVRNRVRNALGARTILICARTGQVAVHDPETDILDLGDGSYARMSDVLDYYRANWHPLLEEDHVDFFGPSAEAIYKGYEKNCAVDLYMKHHKDGKV